MTTPSKSPVLGRDETADQGVEVVRFCGRRVVRIGDEPMSVPCGERLPCPKHTPQEAGRG